MPAPTYSYTYSHPLSLPDALPIPDRVRPFSPTCGHLAELLCHQENRVVPRDNTGAFRKADPTDDPGPLPPHYVRPMSRPGAIPTGISPYSTAVRQPWISTRRRPTGPRYDASRSPVPSCLLIPVALPMEARSTMVIHRQADPFVRFPTQAQFFPCHKLRAERSETH